MTNLLEQQKKNEFKATEFSTVKLRATNLSKYQDSGLSTSFGEDLYLEALTVSTEYLNNLSRKGGKKNVFFTQYITNKKKAAEIVAYAMVCDIQKSVSLTFKARQLLKLLCSEMRINYLALKHDNAEMDLEGLKFCLAVIRYVIERTTSFQLYLEGEYLVSLTSDANIDLVAREYKATELDVKLGFIPSLIPLKPRISPTDNSMHFTETPLFKKTNGLTTAEFKQRNELNVGLLSPINKLEAVSYKVQSQVLDIFKSLGALAKKHPKSIDEYLSFCDQDTITDKVIDKAKDQVDLTHRILDAYEAYRDADEFYLSRFIDHRGRVCVYSNDISPAGNQLQKAMIVFANGETATPETIKQLKLSLAGFINFSIDGKTITGDKVHKRVALRVMNDWLKKHFHHFMNGKWTFITDNLYMFDAPISAIAVLVELCNIYKDPNYKTGYICHQDARCSGLALASTMLNDQMGMRYTSVLDDDNSIFLLDAYQRCADAAKELASPELLKYPELFSRSAFKNRVMTRSSYGLGDLSLRRKSNQFVFELGIDLDKEHMKEYADISRLAIDGAFKGSCKWLSMMLEIGNEIKHTDGLIKVKGPLTGITRMWREERFEKTRVEIMVCGRTIKHNIIRPTGKINKRKTVSALAANIMHLIDSEVLMTLVNNCPFDLSVLHDSFGCLPSKVEDMRNQYNKIMFILNQSSFFQEVIANLKQDNEYTKFDDQFDATSILLSNHSIC